MKNVESIYLIGIGGAAMAPLAGMLAERGYRVTGSDTGVYPPASTLLEKLGIRWHSGFSEEHLNPAPDLVVIGNAASRGNPEVEFVLDHKIPYRSLPEMVREFFLPGHDSLVVAGTHGKTTTTAMLAWIFESAGRQPDFLVGGVADNFGKSYGLGGGREFIIEGDEYDSAFFDKGPKFLHYRPDDLIITSLEFDHADIYADLAAIELQFRRLVNLVPRRGRIVCWGESETVRGVVAKALCKVETYGFSPGQRLGGGRYGVSRRSDPFSRGLRRRGARARAAADDRAAQRAQFRWRRWRSRMAVVFRAKPWSRRWQHFAAWRAGCRCAGKQRASRWWTILRTTRRRSVPR